jgi:hypothetical protein
MSGSVGPSSEGWGWDEAVLVLAATLEDPSRRSLGWNRLNELADLIGRSPAAISLKVGGYRTLEGGESARTRRVSSVQRAVVREFAGRPDGLQREGARIRARRLESLPTPRVERGGRESGPWPSSAIVAGIARETGYPGNGCFPFSYGHGDGEGWALSPTTSLSHFPEATRFVRGLAEAAAKGIRTSAGFRRVQAGHPESFRRGLLSWKLPTLHLRELSSPDLARLAPPAMRREVHSVFVTLEDGTSVGAASLAAAREAIHDVLGLATHRLCPSCVICLGYVAHQVETKVCSLAYPRKDNPT